MRPVSIVISIAIIVVGLVSWACSSTELPSVSTGPKPIEGPVTTTTATPPPSIVVQYCSDGDRRNAVTLSKAQAWPIVHGCSADDISSYPKWVLVGGQYANPLYKKVFGDAVVQEDEGYIVIKMTDKYAHSDKVRVVWGVAGWSEADTLQAVAYVVEKGLPRQTIRIRR